MKRKLKVCVSIHIYIRDDIVFFCVAGDSFVPITTPVVVIASVFVVLIATALILCIPKYVLNSQNISVVIADTIGVREC